MKQLIEYRDRLSRSKRWQQMDEDVDYSGANKGKLDKDVVNPSQIRTVIRSFKENLFTTLFPRRKEVPKTLIFAKTDSHADDIIQIVREEFGEGNERLLTKAEELQPDLIAVTGDLIDREEQLAMVPSLMEGLSEIAPTYYVTGNHEWGIRRVNDLKELLKTCGVTVLSGNYVLLEREEEYIAVAGVDDPSGPEGLAAGTALKEKILAEQGEIFTIFLSHRDSIDVYGEWGFDLTLCGHGHGGIFRVPVLDKGLLSTDRTFFPEYDGGVYALDGGNTCVISRGLGSNTVPIHAFRLFNRPDLPLVVLQRREPA
jgi:predicted MPP superfamily phosphohydrolase